MGKFLDVIKSAYRDGRRAVFWTATAVTVLLAIFKVFGLATFLTDISWAWLLLPLTAFLGLAYVRRYNLHQGQVAKYGNLVLSHKPQLEILGLVQDKVEQYKRWYLEVHNKSKTASLERCLVQIESTTVIEGNGSLESNLTLATQNQWREGRPQGRFDLDPDGTKRILICEPIDSQIGFFRIYFAQNMERKLHRGKYRLYLKLSTPHGEPIRATILISDNSIQLEQSET